MVFLFVEETKQRSLEELDHIFAVSKREFIRFKVSSYLPWVVRKYVFGLERPEPKLYRDLVWGSQTGSVMRAPIKTSYLAEDGQTGIQPRTNPSAEAPKFSDTGLPDVAEMEEIYPPGVHVPYAREYQDGQSPGPKNVFDDYNFPR